MSGILFKNGFFPYDAKHAQADAIYVENGIIQAIGRSAELSLQLSGKSVRIVDWAGAYVTPGLVDSHMHLGMYGVKLDMLDFTDVTSKEEMLHLLRERAALTPPGEWILGLNWNENAFPNRLAPTLEELDAITNQHPIFLTRVCFHTFLVNSVAYTAAGLVQGCSDPEAGVLGRDTTGNFNGWVYENACAPFEHVQPKPDYAAKKATIRKACLDGLRLGLTGAHTEDLRYLGDVSTMLRIHRELREEGIYFRTHQLLYYPFLEEAVALGVQAGALDEWLSIGATKIFADGAIGSRTALLKAPYSDAPNTRGMTIHTEEELAHIVQKARSLGYPIAVHAIGDGAADLTLSAMEKHPLTSQSRLPDRFIHAQVLDAGLLTRMAKLPLIADIQPRFVASDFPWVLDRVGEQRTEYLYAWRKLVESGIICAGGSDAPIEPLDPLLGIHAAITRTKPGNEQVSYLPGEKLSFEQSLELFTLGSARAVAEEKLRGSIAVGKAADLSVFDRDISANADSLLEAKVRMSVVNGTVAYES